MFNILHIIKSSKAALINAEAIVAERPNSRAQAVTEAKKLLKQAKQHGVTSEKGYTVKTIEGVIPHRAMLAAFAGEIAPVCGVDLKKN